MKIGRSFWAVPVLAILSTPATTLTGFLADDEAGVAPASVSLASVPSISMYLSAPGVEGPVALGGTLIETFAAYDNTTWDSNTFLTQGTVLNVGTVSAITDSNSLKVYLAGQGASTTSASAVDWGRLGGSGAAALQQGKNVTITLTSPKNYIGFLWMQGDAGNTVRLLSGGQEIGRFTTADVVSLIPRTPGGATVSAINAGSYLNLDYWASRYFPSTQSATFPDAHAFINIVAPQGVDFDAIGFDQAAGGAFEFDNLTVANYSGSFDLTGLVGVPLTYTLSYNLQGGSGAGTNSSSPLVGSAVALPAAPTRAGYAFTGWYTAASGGSPLGGTFTQTSPLSTTLYAQWAPIVTFDANGANGTSATQSATGNTALQANTYTRSGYTFAGWNTTISGTGTSYADGATFNFTTPTTLYAQWLQASTPPPPPTPASTTPTTTVAPTTTIPATTIPATTIPATSVPATTVPAPIADTAGELPTLQPGDSMVTDNGNPVPVEVFFDNTNTLVMRGQDFELNLAGDCAGGCTVVSDDTGRETIELQQTGNALVNGFGFMPGTLVHIWMFSEPTYLGALTVANDGTFQGSVYLEGIAPGTHTLQVNGTSFDGNDRSANLGVIVAANTNPAGPLPATGGGNTAPQLVLAALAMVMLGALARRRA